MGNNFREINHDTKEKMKKNISSILAALILSVSIFAQASNLLSTSAKAEFNKENFEPCIAEMSKYIKLKPTNDAAYFERGRCLFFSASGEKGYGKIKYEKAKTISDEAKLIEATNAEFDSRRTRAIEDATSAIKLNPKNAAAYNLRGLVTLQIFSADSEVAAKRSAAAIADFNQALKVDPKFVKAYINRGMELYANSDYEAALADFKKASELEPKNETASKLLPLAEKKIKEMATRGEECLKFEQAYLCVPEITRYAELHPNSAKAFLDLARINNSVQIYTEVTNPQIFWKDAEAAYLKTIKLNPSGIEAYVELFDLYKEKLRSKQNAKVVADAAVERIPLEPRSYILRGRSYEAEQNWTAAIADFSRAIKIAPGYSQAYERRSNSYAGLKQFDTALADLNKAIELDKNNGSAYLARGDFYNYQKKLNEAIADFTNADKLNVTCSKTRRGAVYTTIAVNNKEPRDSANYAKAKQDFLADDARKCFDTNNQYGVMLFTQGLLKEADEQFAKALSDYKKFGYNTAQIEKFKVTLEELKALTVSQTGSVMAEIIEKYRSEAIAAGHIMIGSGISNSNQERTKLNVEQDKTYIAVAVIEDHSPFEVALWSQPNGVYLPKTHEWDDQKYQIEPGKDYAMKYKIIKVGDQSVLLMNIGFTKNSKISQINFSTWRKDNGKPVQWIFYRLK